MRTHMYADRARVWGRGLPGCLFLAMACLLHGATAWGGTVGELDWDTEVKPYVVYDDSIGAAETIRYGNGPSDARNLHITASGSIVIGGGNAISLGSGTDNDAVGNMKYIYIENGATVQNQANSGGGLYNTGPNVIEVGSNYYIRVEGEVNAMGTASNGEAINLHGVGNVVSIAAGGVVHSEHGAALWFQDVTTSDDIDARNVVHNEGTISTGRGPGANVFGSSRGTSGPGLVFYNRGLVDGSLLFANGDDSLTFFTGSKVTGNIDGGGGTNDLTLDSTSALPGDVLEGAVRNFTTLTKTGSGVWEISGTLEGFTRVEVDDGSLRLTGDNNNFSGQVYVNGGSLDGRAQSMPTNHPVYGNTNNIILAGGDLNFEQDDDGTYIGQIVGSGNVYKSGAGDTILNPESGANTYDGLTTITSGGLGISTGDALGTGSLTIASSNIPNSTPARLVAMASLDLDNLTGPIVIGDGTGTSSGAIEVLGSAEMTINQGLQGDTPGFATETFLKTGSGILTLNGVNTFIGETFVDGGTLRVNNKGAGNLVGNITVLAGSRLEGTGSVGQPGSTVHNAGIIEPGTIESPYDTFTIRGAYEAASGARVVINTVLGDDSSVHGTLHVNSLQGSIPTDIRVINNGGAGDMAAVGIPIIQIDNYTPGDENLFRLAYDYRHTDGTTTVIGGVTVYHLVYDAVNGLFRLKTLTNPDGTPVANPVLPLYESLPQVLATFNRLPTLQQRVGNRSWAPLFESPYSSLEANASLATDRRDIEQAGIWSRIEGSTGKVRGDRSETRASFDVDFSRFQFGVDTPLVKTGGGRLVGGLNAFIGKTWADVKSPVGHGDIDTYGWGFGGSLTWYGENGMYADFQSQISCLFTDITSKELATGSKQVDDNDGYGFANSLEIGYEYFFCSNWSITPQAQMQYSIINFDSYRDPQGTDVRLKDGDSLIGRAGVALAYENGFAPGRRLMGHVVGNVYHEFLDGSKVRVANTHDFRFRGDRTSVGLAVGGTYEWCDNRYSVFGEVGYRASVKHFSKTRDLYGEVGVRFRF